VPKLFSIQLRIDAGAKEVQNLHQHKEDSKQKVILDRYKREIDRRKDKNKREIE
jgi:hypothetical protein